jgi:pilus assembly protein CpaC
MTNRVRIGILILFVALAGATVLYAEEPDSVNLLVGRSTIIDVGTPIARVSLTSPDIADALVTSSAQLLLHGKTPGTISMFVWDRGGAIRRYDVIVQRDLSRLSSQVLELFPGEKITVQGNGKSVVVAGIASSKYIAEKAVEVAAGYVEKKEDVVNLLQVQTGGTNQVLLRVRFAEVNRTALTELGAAYILNGFKTDWFGRATTQQYPAPDFDSDKPGGLVFSDFLNLFVFNNKEGLGAVIKALQTKGMFQSLAEPNLVAESGKEASFLAGGEIPVPIAQGTGGNVAISVQWKEFGIRLNFTPTVNGDRVALKVRPEVSVLDFSNAVVLQGFRIPALSTRRADTEIELQNRQTFAIAGLLNNAARSTLQKVPGIGDIPVLGLLFRSKAAQKENTELVVMITPEILAPNSSGVTPNLPRLTEPFMAPPPVDKTFTAPPPAFGRSGSGASNAAPEAGATTAGSALTPSQGAPIGQVTPDAQAAPTAAPRPRTKAERKAFEEAERIEREREKADLREKIEQEKYDKKAAAEQAEKDQLEKERQEKVAREQAKRDAEVAKRQAEIDRQRQREIDEAAAKLKAAEEAYQAELAKRGNVQSPTQPK